MARPFTPSSNDLLYMLSAADRKFEAAREQAALKKEADAIRRIGLIEDAKAGQRRRQAWAV